jgi:hypothetical protein
MKLEAFSVVLETLRWAKQWRNKRVIIFFDNMATVTWLNKGTSKYRTLGIYIGYSHLSIFI